MKTRWVDIIIIVIALLLIPFLLETFAAWDNANPTDAQTWNSAAATIRANWTALEVELGVNLNEAHPYYQSAAPSTKPDSSTALDVDDNGRLWVDSDDNTIYVLSDYSGPTWTSTAAATGLTEADAAFTLQNTDEEDSDGGRQSRFISKGEQSGGEATTLGYSEFFHVGTSDDEKGGWRIKLNDGDDSDAPSKQPIGYLPTGKINVSSSLSVLDEDDMSSDDDEVVPTQQSVKAFVTAAKIAIGWTHDGSTTINLTTLSGTWQDVNTGIGSRGIVFLKVKPTGAEAYIFIKTKGESDTESSQVGEGMGCSAGDAASGTFWYAWCETDTNGYVQAKKIGGNNTNVTITVMGYMLSP